MLRSICVQSFVRKDFVNGGYQIYHRRNRIFNSNRAIVLKSVADLCEMYLDQMRIKLKSRIKVFIGRKRIKKRDRFNSKSTVK